MVIRSAAQLEPAAHLSAQTDVAISLEGVSKAYRAYRRQWDRVREWLGGGPRHRLVWALRNVTLDVRLGEIIGIIGRNGAGKTTLLRLISGITLPTSGSIDVRYRLATILELGTGFHPEFTGRENIHLGGAILGLTRGEIDARFGWITTFAELGDDLDLPFRTYSLGMQARLTFAVAASVEPDILLIDEALAAGDAYFMGKCFARIREICAGGSTVLFVSHNTYVVQHLARRALWIDGGQIVLDGDPAEVCREYDAAIRAQEAVQLAAANVGAGGGGPRAGNELDLSVQVGGERLYTFGTKEVRLTGVELLGADGRPATVFYSGEPMTIRLHYQGSGPYEDLCAAVLVTRPDGVAACTASTCDAGMHLPELQGKGYMEVTLDPLLLGRGRYYVSPHLYRDRPLPSRDDVLDYHDRLYQFQVERRGRPYDVALEQPARWRIVQE